MDLLQWILLIGLALYLLKRFMPAKGVAQITAAEATAKMAEKTVQFVDVRTPQEFRSRHIAPFRSIPLNDFKQRVQELDKEREVVLLCASGVRSTQAAKILKRQGFKTVNNVKGGLAAWSI